MQPIDQQLLIVVADEFAPDLTITSPEFGTPYISEMTVTGVLLDSTQEEGDNQGIIRTIVLDFLDNAQFNRWVEFDDEGEITGSQPELDPDDPFFQYDMETGDFSF